MNRYILGLLGTITLLPALTLTSTPAPSGPTIPERCQASVVHIGTPEAQGSGVLFQAKNGTWWVWTVAHVVTSDFGGETIRYVDVTFFNRETVPGETVRVDRAEDIALLRLRDSPNGGVSVVWGSGQRPRVGEGVYHAGCPFGRELEFSVTHGIVSYVGRHVRGQVWDQTASPCLPGSSGGGIFRESNGECLGLVSLGWGEAFICYVPEFRVRSFAARTGVSFAVDPTLDVPTSISPQADEGHRRVEDNERGRTLPYRGFDDD